MVKRWPKFKRPQKPSRDQVLFVVSLIVAFVLVDLTCNPTYPVYTFFMEVGIVLMLTWHSRAILTFLHSLRA